MHPPPPADLSFIRQYIRRGNQLEKHDPVIAYYCYTRALDMILPKIDLAEPSEALVYAERLMNDLEQRKTESEGNVLYARGDEARAYVMRFAKNVFAKSEDAINGGRANAGTGDALWAAAIFLDLLNLFSLEEDDVDDPEATDEIKEQRLDDENFRITELPKMIKYAKAHASRILDNIKNGIDPNAPMIDPELEEEAAAAEAAELAALPAPTVEEVPDEHFGSNSAGPAVSSLHNSSSPTTAPRDDTTMSTPPEFQRPPSPPSQLPSVPTQFAPSAPSLPDVPQHVGYSPSAPSLHEVSQSDLMNTTDTSYQQQPSAPPVVHNAPGFQPPLFAPPPMHHTPAPAYQQPQQYTAPAMQSTELEPEDITKVQKMARYAVSSLDYDDIANAVEQFRSGLKVLGGPIPPARGPLPRQLPQDVIQKAQKYAKWTISALDYEDVENAIEQCTNGLKTLGAA
ncbi:Vta1 like-domain-containing protein [Pyronema omphalodes]|nr:Vta1 like-domain-containing protein [Pyronema omphalodes]